MNSLVCFWKEEDGMGVVEMVLIIVVLIALVALFKDKIYTLVSDILTDIETEAGKI